ncbi:endonuclease [Pectobacterium phage Phoria]|uniref:Uncharacterized protein n=2 Tax=Phimunavirus TaxID=2560202 RepID=A0A385IF99_9CAUD|nr:endonuclease [Pectobacterium phage Gaspode]YP_009817288.1 endonuclease [Pectobacterium phage Phoria]AXY81679.1 hypothetical protein [Pectobacterium phage Gaspode]AZF94929.1 hypothetical protein [Pectobacterium phage Phoria]
MARKKQVQEATDILDNLEVQQAHEMGDTLGSTSTKLRNQVVLSLLHSASVYSISDEGILRARVRRCMEIADIVVDELEKKND